MVHVALSMLLSLQLDNADEQAAQVRRELDSRLHTAEAMAKVGAKVHFTFLILCSG